MRIMAGSRVTEAPASWRDDALATGREIVVDVGTGDGRWVYESARHDAAGLYVGIDPDADAMGEYAYRAARKPARGGVDNVTFVVASIEQLPPKLTGIASLVRVNFPWGGLLRGLLRPHPPALEALRSLARDDARFEIVLSYDPAHDLGATADDPLPAPDTRLIDDVLVPAYAAAGIVIELRRIMLQDEAIALPSTWGRRLLHGRDRDVWYIEGRAAARSANLVGGESGV